MNKIEEAKQVLREYIVYDIELEEAYYITGVQSVAKFLGIDTVHVNNYVTRTDVIRGRFCAYYKDTFDDISRVQQFAKVPNKLVTLAASEFKVSFRNKIHNSLKNKYPTGNEPKDILIFDENNKVVDVAKNHREAAKKLNMKLGSVKVRLQEVKDWDGIYKWKMCKVENFNNLLRRVN